MDATRGRSEVLTARATRPMTSATTARSMDYRHAMFSRTVLDIDAPAEAERIADTIRAQVLGDLRRRGVVVAISGGIDSSVVAALAARAVGPERVLGLSLPERDASDDALRLARSLVAALGIRHEVQTITAALQALGCYDRQDEALCMVFPDYRVGDRFKIVMPSILAGERLNLPQVAHVGADGVERRARPSLDAYLQLVAATNFKQRTRKMLEYYHADRLNYAVAGTPNLLEYDQGFFVKQGDGAADIKPIAHLYKTQVFALADYLGVPEEIRIRTPTTDTFSLAQTQEEFYFALPYHQTDLCLWARDHDVSAEQAAPVVELTPEQVERVYRDIDAKRRASRYLHHVPVVATRPSEG
jgi:NAD+ synthase